MLQITPIFRIISLLSDYSRRAFLLLGLVVVATGLEITVPFITQGLVDTLVNHFKQTPGRSAPLSTLAMSGVAILFATAGTKIIRSYYNYELFKTSTRVEDEAKSRAFSNYLRLHPLYHRESSSGQIIGRIDRGATAVFTVLFDIFGQSLVPPLVIFTGVVLSLAFKSGWIALAVCLPVPVYLIAVRRLTIRISQVEQKVSEHFEEVSKESYDIASNALTVKKFGRERDEVARQRMLLRRARDTQYQGERIWAVIENVQSLIATIGRVTVIVLGGALVLRGKCTVGEFVLFVTLQDMAYQPISQLSIIFPKLRRNLSRAERLFAVMDERPGIMDKPGALTLAPLRESIEFRNVWFRYNDSQKWVLENVSLRIPAGATVALVGRSGSGKTTFINLLLRSFEPQRGSIQIDGVDIRDVTQDSLLRQIAVVPQEVDLFSRSIAENIGYGKIGARREDIERAARTALAHDFVLRSSQQYETVVGERGMKLSGGERQRIGIARAIVRNPQILILDEATSHLDAESEALIQTATETVVQNRTALVIAHRLSTVINADFIVVFHESRIEAVGTHAELLKISPTYRNLCELQFGEPPVEEASPRCKVLPIAVGRA